MTSSVALISVSLNEFVSQSAAPIRLGVGAGFSLRRPRRSTRDGRSRIREEKKRSYNLRSAGRSASNQARRRAAPSGRSMVTRPVSRRMKVPQNVTVTGPSRQKASTDSKAAPMAFCTTVADVSDGLPYFAVSWESKRL